MADSVGQRLGNYRLVRLLGQGGFAQVYLGEHQRLGTQAAIKLLSTHLSDDEVEKFLAEARIIARLEHPHIIRILDFDVEQDVPFLVMSYAPNGTMRRRFPKGTRLPLDIILTYLKQAADALQYAHVTKLIHRDIKPENLLLGRQNEMLLSDFGIAIVAHSSRSQSMQEILGTTAEIATQHLHANPPPLRELIPGMPPAIEAVVHKALEKDPHRRFASVQEFATAFEQACQSFLPATTAMPAGPAGRLLSATQAPGQASFYASPTLAGSELELPKAGRRGVSRRALLFGTIGIVGFAGTCGCLALLALSHKPALGNTLVTYTGHLSPVATVAWSPDGNRIASGSGDQTVQVWDASSGAHPFIYRGHTTNINAVAWSPARTNQRIASQVAIVFLEASTWCRYGTRPQGCIFSLMKATRNQCIPWHGRQMARALPPGAKTRQYRSGMPAVEARCCPSPGIKRRYLRWPGLLMARASPRQAMMKPCKFGMLTLLCPSFASIIRVQ